MKAGAIMVAAIGVVLGSSHVPLVACGQTPPKPEAAAVAAASEARAVVESVDKQARQVLLHLPDDTLLTLTVPPDVKTIDKLKPGDRVAVTYYDAAVIHLAKAEGSATEKAASGGPTKDQIQGVRTVVGVDQSRGTITLADARNHIETLNVPDRSMLRTVKPGDNVDVTYTEAIDISLEPA